MKKRFSVERAEWSSTREEQYKADCYDIVFQYGDTLNMIDGAVYITKDSEQIKIAEPDKPSKFWYETWLAVKNFYGLLLS